MGSEQMTGGMSEKTVGRLKFVSGVMGVLIILCLVLLVYGVSQKAGELASTGAPASGAEAVAPPPSLAAPDNLPNTLTLPAGMVVQSIAPSRDGGLWLFADQNGTQHLLRLDDYGQLVQQIKLDAGT